MGKWHETSCADCGDAVHYLEDWNRVPDLCKPCIAARKAKWHEKTCRCGNTIKYHENWDRIPDLCKPCIEQKRAARAKWHEKSCSCGATIKYHDGWSNVPTHCKECQNWLTKPCAARGCTGEVRYRRYWDRIPEYCPSCKKGERRITIRQRKDDGSVHEYTGRGYVNRQGVAVFSDDTGDGKHGHAAYRPDGLLRGSREEGHDQDWVNEPVNVTFSPENRNERKRQIRKSNRFSTMYKDRRTDNHVHDFSRRDYHEVPGPVPNWHIRPSEGSAGEYHKEEKNKKGE